MRVAMLSDCYLPRLGGIEVQVHDLARRLVDKGHEVEVFTITPGAGGGLAPVEQVEQVDGITVHRYGIRLPRNLLVNPAAAPRVLGQLRRFDVAHIHMGVVSPFAVDAALVARRTRTPATMTWHCVLHRAEPVVRSLGVVRHWARSGMAMNAVSDIAAQPLRRITGEPVAVLPNGIDVSVWRSRPRPRRDPGTVRVVSAMRLERRKRPVELVEILARVRAAVPAVDVRLEILGEGADRPKVERAVERLGAQGWVSLPGRVPRSDLPERYAASDVYVSAAVLESFGIAALEARCAGLPVVARAGTGLGEFVVDDVNGYLARDDDELVRRLVSLVVHDSIRQRMRAHNLATEPAQAWDAVVGQAEAEYRRARDGGDQR